MANLKEQMQREVDEYNEFATKTKEFVEQRDELNNIIMERERERERRLGRLTLLQEMSQDVANSEQNGSGDPSTIEAGAPIANPIERPSDAS